MIAAHRSITVQPPQPGPLDRLRAVLGRHFRLRPAHSLILVPALLAGALLAGPAGAATSVAPRLQDFTDYSLYVQAMVDYRQSLEEKPKVDEKTGGDASKLCRDSKGGSQDEKKKNNCEGKYLEVEHRLPDDNERQAKQKVAAPAEEAENLEEAISRRSTSFLSYDGTAPAAGPDATPRGFPLQEIPTADLSEAGVAGLLGLFNNARLQNLGGSAAPGGVFGASTGGSGAGGYGGSAMDKDGTLTITADDYLLQLATLDLDQLASTVSFGDGYSIVSATVRTQGNGLSIGLSAQVYTPVYIVDRDGLPGTQWAGAGAVVVDHMAILIPYVQADIQSVRTTSSDSSLLQMDVYSPGAIYVDLANTNVGVAGASVDGSRIGASTPFLQFGPSALLTIAPGTRVRATLSTPDGLRTPLVTLNGSIGALSIRDVRIVDSVAGGSIGFGRLGVSSLDLVDARIYMNNNSVVVDTGHSLSNVNVDIERFYLGNDRGGNFVGDFYARGATLDNLRFTATPH